MAFPLPSRVQCPTSVHAWLHAKLGVGHYLPSGARALGKEECVVVQHILSLLFVVCGVPVGPNWLPAW
jgi:hypothetical protein